MKIFFSVIILMFLTIPSFGQNEDFQEEYIDFEPNVPKIEAPSEVDDENIIETDEQLKKEEELNALKKQNKKDLSK